MYETSAFNAFVMFKDFLNSTLKEHLEGKSLEELNNDNDLLKNAVSGAKKR